MKTAATTSTNRNAAALNMPLVVVVNVVGAALLLIPTIWTVISLSEMSGSTRGYTDLDNAIRGEENFKVGFSLTIFVLVAAFFLVVDRFIFGVPMHLKYAKAWVAAIAILMLPPALVFGYFAAAGL